MVLKKDIYLFNFEKTSKYISFLYLTKKGFYKVLLDIKTGEPLQEEHINKNIQYNIIENKGVYTLYIKKGRILGIAEKDNNISYGVFSKSFNEKQYE